MEIFRKIAEKARDAKTQFDETRRAAKESVLAQTEQRLDALQAELLQKSSLLDARERALQEEESRLLKIARRPMYVFILCTLSYLTGSVFVLRHYDLVVHEALSAPEPVATKTKSSVSSVSSAPTVPDQVNPDPAPSQLSAKDASIRETYQGIDLTRPKFDIGRHCLNAEKKGHITFEECLGLAAAKAKGEGAW